MRPRLKALLLSFTHLLFCHAWWRARRRARHGRATAFGSGLPLRRTLRASRCGASAGWAAGPRLAAPSTTTSILPVRPAPRGDATSAGCFRAELVGWQTLVYFLPIWLFHEAEVLCAKANSPFVVLRSSVDRPQPSLPTQYSYVLRLEARFSMGCPSRVCACVFKTFLGKLWSTSFQYDGPACGRPGIPTYPKCRYPR